MNQNVDSNGFPWSEFFESTAGLWFSTARDWQKLTFSLADFPRSDDYMQAPMSMWQAFLSPWGAMEPSGDKRNTQSDWIEAFLQVMGPGQMSRDMSRLLWSSLPGVGFENAQQDALRAWTDIYERAVQPLLKVPQVGLTRVFQEKIGQLADKFTTYQRAVSEFQMLLSGPMDKAFADMREQLDRSRAKGEPTEDYRACYGMWIKALKGHFMTLFRSDQYRTALSRLLNETAAFRISGDDVLTEFLQFLPIPTNKEMDDLYKDIYTLRKAVKEAAKKIKRLESALAGKAAVPLGSNLHEGDVQ